MIGGVYLAYPIDQREPASLGYLFEQIERFKAMMLESGAVSWVFDPGDAFRVNPRAALDDSLPRINRAALNNADLVVAFLPAGVPTIGVPMEIDRARAQGKHVLVFSDARAYMLEMPGIARIGNWEQVDLDHALLWVKGLDRPAEARPREDLRVMAEQAGFMPRRAYDDDAGLDLVVSEDTVVPLGEFVDVPCGVSVELPHWSWGLVTGRSSAFRNRGLLVLPGVIDAGYRGPLFAGAWAQRETVEVKAGERIAQLIVLSNMTRNVEPIRVEQLSDSPRGAKGFGSSGA